MNDNPLLSVVWSNQYFSSMTRRFWIHIWVLCTLFFNTFSFAHAEDLMALISRGDSAAVTAAIADNSAIIIQQLPNGCTPLAFAVRESKLNLVRILVNEGADLENGDGCSSQKFSPLALSLYHKNYEIADVLLNAGADPNVFIKENRPILFSAVKRFSGDAEASKWVKLLLHHGAKPDFVEKYKGRAALHYAITKDFTATIHSLLIGGADVTLKDNEGRSPLYYSLYPILKDKEIIHALINAGASVNNLEFKKGSPERHSIFCDALENNRPTVVQQMLDAGAEVNRNCSSGGVGETPMAIIIQGRYTKLDRLALISKLSKKGDINTVNEDSGDGLLHLAARRLHGNELYDVASKLLELGADPNLPNLLGLTALHILASHQGNENVVKLLVQTGGADVNAIDLQDRTPLYIARHEAGDSMEKAIETLGGGESISLMFIELLVSIKYVLTLIFTSLINWPSFVSIFLIMMLGVFQTSAGLRVSARTLRAKRARARLKKLGEQHPSIKEELESMSKVKFAGGAYYFAMILCLIPLQLGVFWAQHAMKSPGAGWISLVFGVILLYFLFPKLKQKAFEATENARRQIQPSADKFLNLEGIQPVLYLRSFIEDDSREAEERFITTLAPQEGSFEAQKVEFLWELGPVVAVGQPGEKLPPLGALRTYFGHAEWQDGVSDLMD
ncbi:ankyrin repeat domain-containing protein, partial [Pseudomonadota bacterium]